MSGVLRLDGGCTTNIFGPENVNLASFLIQVRNLCVIFEKRSPEKVTGEILFRRVTRTNSWQATICPHKRPIFRLFHFNDLHRYLNFF